MTTRAECRYDMARAQVDVSLKTVVTGAADLPQMGTDDLAARAKCERYVTKALGQFTKWGLSVFPLVIVPDRTLVDALRIRIWIKKHLLLIDDEVFSRRRGLHRGDEGDRFVE